MSVAIYYIFVMLWKVFMEDGAAVGRTDNKTATGKLLLRPQQSNGRNNFV